jgi:hypothetical protein
MYVGGEGGKVGKKEGIKTKVRSFLTQIPLLHGERD